MSAHFRSNSLARRALRLAPAALALPLVVGCLNFGGAADETPPPPTIRQVRAEWREMERSGLLPVLQSPLAPDEDFAARLAPTSDATMSHARETNAALARLRETAEQIEDPETRDTFLEADRERDETRTQALLLLFYRRYDDGVDNEMVWKEWNRLDQAFALLEQDAWVEEQRLTVLQGMLAVDVARSKPRLLEALNEGTASDSEIWGDVIGNLPSPAGEPGRSLWKALADVEFRGEPAQAVIDYLAYEDSLAGVPHPLNSPEEIEFVRERLRSEDPADFGLKKSILSGAKLFPSEVASELYEIGENDPSPAVQIHALFAGAKKNPDERRVSRLVELYEEDERYAASAQQMLTALNRGYRARRTTDPDRRARELAYQRCGSLRYQVDSTPEELTLVAQTTAAWSLGETDQNVYVFYYRLPDEAQSEVDPSIRERAIAAGNDLGPPTAYEELTGYAAVIDETVYVFSTSEVETHDCRTALDVAALAHRDYIAYGEDYEPLETPLPEYVDELVAEDSRWEELHAPLETEDESDETP